jgi:plasmid stabilization system protein ParE
LYFTNKNAILADKSVDGMPNIKPVSDLRNYNEVLKGVGMGAPVFLTKNGRGRYAILDMREYEKTQATLKLMSELANPDAELLTITHITKRIRELERVSETGAPLSSVVDMETNYRFLVCKNYLMFYRVEGQDVYVVRVLYGKRDYLTVLFGGSLPN